MNLKDIFDTLDLNRGMRRILIVEDAVGFAERLTDKLKGDGHQVTTFLGIDEISGTIAQGLSINETSETIDLAHIDVVFLDHYFLSDTLNGGTFTKAIRALSQARILAMSSDEAANARMVALGAAMGINKSKLRRMIGQ